MDVNGLITKVTWKIEVLSDVGSKSMGRNGQLTKVTWRIENFSTIQDKKLCSENFTVDGNKWQLIIYPGGANEAFLSIFLGVADSATLASGWTRYAHFGLLSSTNSIVKIPKHEAVELEQPAEEDMNTFFTILEYELSSSRIVYSKEEAKEALAKINEALNMTPVDLNDSGKISPLKQAFMILASFDGSSTTLTIEQKNELLGLEERLKELANRAAKAVQDKNQLTAKESIKRTMTRSLESSLIRYKEVETEVKQVDQILAARHEEVVEAQKKREKMLAERNGIYRSCKEMKMKLDALGKEWAVYEATARVGEEEEKSVEAEWGRIKDFISSINGKI
ncbi:protein RESTRICTED TEV MOVEMENT 3-like isoform X1 [Gossypium raimondii]|uniref:MATH domain-containing protein n=1 Tax=Gossypium raimondii TaxID=29730 RepID=A0A0D2VQI4_GOSRA|nr:protein RESTRICTED TEV MOVEMENT 3-like isoform X1 [Gossypium raimondii]KJB73320.1 hypothetical protein B456_011G227700 [Gossypium raimondii]